MTHSFPTRRSSDLSAHALQLQHAIMQATAFHLTEQHILLQSLADAVLGVGDVDELIDQGQVVADDRHRAVEIRSEEHTSELQSLMRISYAVFCLKKKNIKTIIRSRARQADTNCHFCLRRLITE